MPVLLELALMIWKKKKKSAKLKALLLSYSALTQGFQEKCSLKEVLCVVSRFYCLIAMQQDLILSPGTLALPNETP